MEILKVWFDEENIFVKTETGHIIGNPLKWFTRLNNATAQQRENFDIGPMEDSIHWEEIDEDLSLESLFDLKRELNYATI